MPPQIFKIPFSKKTPCTKYSILYISLSAYCSILFVFVVSIALSKLTLVQSNTIFITLFVVYLEQ
jgi:hypothetical protein